MLANSVTCNDTYPKFHVRNSKQNILWTAQFFFFFFLQSDNIASQNIKIKVLSSRRYDMKELFFSLGKMRDFFFKGEIMVKRDTYSDVIL